MTDMLGVTAFQVSYPVVFFVFMESDDLLFHRAGLP
jgi:hypothetical protein